MFSAWRGPLARPTRDVDLLGQGDSAVEAVVQLIREVCETPVLEDDGLRFHPEALRGEPIAEATTYRGVRVLATLGKARVRFRVDVGFGDVLVPGPVAVRLPSLLALPGPEVQGYSRESAVAEKFQAMVYLGEINSRMKDFYDVWWLATHFGFDGLLLGRAIDATFHRRGTTLVVAPPALTAAFAAAPQKQSQWQAFVRRHPSEDVPPTLSEAVQMIAALLQPLLLALVEGRASDGAWLPGGPWQELPPGSKKG
jgi:hypothetical protein